VGDEGFAKAPIGTGPYRLVERKPREYVKLAAFDQHWAGPPKIRDVTMKIVPDDQARIAQIQTGEADLVVTVPLIFAARMQNAPNFKIIRVTSYNNGVFVINNRGNNPYLRDRNVRVALNMAINKPALARALTFGFASLHEIPCTKGMIACDQSMVQPYAYDPKAARELLVKAGYDFNRPLKIVGGATGRIIQGKETVEGVAQLLNAVGLKTEVVVLEYGTWAATAFAKEKDPTIDLYYLTAPDASRDAAPRLARIMKTGETMSFYSDPALDEAFENASRMPTADQYQEALKGVYRKIHDDAVTIPLWSYDSIYAVRNELDWSPYQNISWPVLRNASWKAS
jgi:peptide/nickel transport system substrate-binding protein